MCPSESCYILCLGVCRGRMPEKTQMGSFCGTEESVWLQQREQGVHLGDFVWGNVIRSQFHGCHPGLCEFSPKSSKMLSQVSVQEKWCVQIYVTQEIMLAAVWLVWWGWRQRREVDSGKLIRGCCPLGWGHFEVRRGRSEGKTEGKHCDGRDTWGCEVGVSRWSRGECPGCLSHLHPLQCRTHGTSPCWMIKTVLVRKASVTVLRP